MSSIPIALESPSAVEVPRQTQRQWSAPPFGAPSGGIPIGKVPQRIVAGFDNLTLAGEDRESPSSVFVSRSQVSSTSGDSRSNSFASTAGARELGDGWGATSARKASVGGGFAADDKATPGASDQGSPANVHRLRQPSVEDLLRDSVNDFHREGPLVNPLEGQRAHAIAGWHDKTAGSSTRDKMQFVTEVKGFDYCIFWRYRPDRKVFEYGDSVNVKSEESSPLSLFIKTSRSMFITWIMGFGMVGRVGYTGNYEWHEEVTSLPGWSFQRSRQAKNAALRTVIGVPVNGGIAEFGSTRLYPHNLLTVQYVQKIMGGPEQG
jgi:hypothetical protein